MTEILIDCTAIRDRTAFHNALAQAMVFPEWYGKNLDALHDCLTDIGTDTILRLLHWGAVEAALGSYGKAAARVMEQADLENPHFFVEFY